MQFNAFHYILAMAAVVHGTAIQIHSPSGGQMDISNPGNATSAIAPLSGQVAPIPAAGSCTCGGVAYSSTQVTSTVTHANPLAANSVQSSGKAKYPHTFNNREKISFPLCVGQVLTEFPLKTSGFFSTGDSPGADRVVYVTGSTGKFCGCIHHINPTDFAACTF